MKTALCLTPDHRFFRQAVCAAATIRAQPDAEHFDIFIVCEERDVAPGWERVAPALREAITLKIVDFSSFDEGARAHGRFSRAVFRRLFLDRILPERYTRILSVDSDIWIARPGLGLLADFDLRGAPLAAAYDMIFLMDFNGGPLAASFRQHRATLGLTPSTPYFNAGMMAIDRAQWSARELGGRAIAALRRAPERYPYLEQSALNELIAGGFAPLSPRYNFMGDFFLLGLEAALAPIAYHFVNAPKPWEYGAWRGEARFARGYRDWFAASPWPDLLEGGAALDALGERRPRLSARRRAFAQRLMTYLRERDFVDGWPEQRADEPRALAQA